MRMMAPAEEVFGGIALHFQRLNTRRCDEFWAGGGGYGYHGHSRGVVQELLVRLMQVPWAWNNRFIPSKNALLLLTKKIHPPFHLACLKYPNILLKYPPKKEGYVRCDSRSIFFLIPIHGAGTRNKKNPSRWNIRVFVEVLSFYSIVKSIDLIGTCLKIL